MIKPLLSICMIVKNEEANLQRCLDSLLPLINWKDDETLEPLAELIIVDTGSTDRTVNIARKFTDKVYQKTFIPWNFSDARNYGIAKAAGEKILIIDADEQLASQDMAYRLMNHIANPEYADFKTVFLMLRNFYTKDLKQFTEVAQPRVFTNDGSPLYAGSIHNKPHTTPDFLFAEDVVLNHYGYQFEGKNELFEQKNNERSLPMLVERNESDPDDLHILTHLVKTYHVVGDYDKVIEHGERWITMMAAAPYDKGWFSFLEIFVNIVIAYLLKGDAASAERVKNEAEKYSNRLINIYYYLGKYFESRDIDKAAEYFETCVNIASEDGDLFELLVSNNTRIILPEILNWLAVHYFSKGKYVEAGNCINEGIRINENRLPLAWDIWNHPEAASRLIGEN